MRSPFLYFPHDGLSPAELTAACLDGHLVGLGEGFLVADSVETAAMRAASVSNLMTPVVTACLDTAAWVWGAQLDPPSRHDFSRLAGTTTAHHQRSALHDLRTAPDDVVTLGSSTVTTPARTVYDLIRRGRADAYEPCRTLIRDYAVDLRDVRRRCVSAGSFPGRRRTFALLRELELASAL